MSLQDHAAELMTVLMRCTNAEYAATILGQFKDDVRTQTLNEAADALEARVADVDVDTRTTWAGMDAAYLRHLAAAPTPPVPDNTAADEPEFAVRWPDGELTRAADREHGLRAIESAHRAEPGAVLMQRSCTPWTEVTS